MPQAGRFSRSPAAALELGWVPGKNQLPVFVTAFRPVAWLGVFGGIMLCPWPKTDPTKRRCSRRWPGLVHLGMLTVYVALFAIHVPPQLAHLTNLGSTARVTFLAYFATTRLGPWIVFCLVLARAEHAWTLIRDMSDVLVRLDHRKLRRHSSLFVFTCFALSTILPFISMYESTGGDPIGLMFAITTWHCEFLLHVVPTHISCLVMYLCTIMKEVNKEIGGAFDWIPCNKGTSQISLLKLEACLDLVERICSVYGLPIALLYFIYLVSITCNSFYIILVGFQQDHPVLSAMTATFVCSKVLSLVAFTLILSQVPKEAMSSFKDLLRIRHMSVNPGARNQVRTLLHRLSGPPVQITAANFFPINRGLLTSISGAFTTYIVVLAQFRGAENRTCSCNSTSA